jgi:hypothetical protein
MHLVTAASALGLACWVLGMSAGPAAAATTHARVASAPAHANGAVQVNGTIKPDTCSPLDYPIRFSPSTTWNSPWLSKSADGCQSVWATSGQTFYYQVINESGGVLAEGWCTGGTTCQLWNPATNNVPFFVYDYTQTTTSANIYY